VQRRFWAAAAAGVVLLAGACSKTDTVAQSGAPTTSATPSTPAGSAAPKGDSSTGAGTTTLLPGAQIGALTPEASSAFLTKVAQQTTAVHTGTFSVTIVVDHATGAPDHVGLLDLSGSYDRDHNNSQLKIDMSGLAKAAPDAMGGALGGALNGGSSDSFAGAMSVIQIGTTEYLQIPGMAALLGASGATSQSWIKSEGDDTAAASFKQLFDMFKVDDISGFLATLQASGKVTQVGNEAIAQAPTIHYHADIDPSKLDTTKNASAGKLLDSFTGAKTAAVDVWVDSDALVHKLTIAADAGALGPELGTTYKDGTATLTMQLADLGKPMTITAPPADQIIDISGSGLGGGDVTIPDDPATTDTTEPDSSTDTTETTEPVDSSTTQPASNQ
jgi:hypothetical protein